MNTTTRASGRALLVVVATTTVLATLGLILNDIVRIAYVFMGGYSIEAALVSYGGVPADVPGGTAESTAEYWKVIISTFENTDTSRMLQALAIGLTTLTFVAGSVTILLLCRRLWTGRTFAVSAAVGLLVVAFLTIATAWVAPWLRHAADELAIAASGYATVGVEGAEQPWVELPYYDLGSVDGAVLVLGVVLALTALVYLSARRLQRDTEGLV